MNCRILFSALTGASLLLNACSHETAPVTHDLIFEGTRIATPEILILDRAQNSVSALLPYELAATDPEPSPDGSRILFVVADYTQWTGDIYVVDRDGNNLQQLTFAPELDDQPSWSPDGTRIVFRSYRTNRDGDIWVMNADGSNPVNLTPDPLPGVWDERRPAWSPDGTRIAYASNAGGNVDIWTMAADGSDTQRLTSTIDLDTEPAWSPDGTTLAFRRSSNSSGSDIYLIAASGGTETPLSLAGEQRLPAWSADGQHLVFVQQDTVSSRPDLYCTRIDAPQLRPLITDQVAGGSLYPVFSARP